MLGDVLISAHSPPYTYSGSFTRSRQFLVLGNFDPRTYSFPSSPPFPLLTPNGHTYMCYANGVARRSATCIAFYALNAENWTSLSERTTRARGCYLPCNGRCAPPHAMTASKPCLLQHPGDDDLDPRSISLNRPATSGAGGACAGVGPGHASRASLGVEKCHGQPDRAHVRGCATMREVPRLLACLSPKHRKIQLVILHAIAFAKS